MTVIETSISIVAILGPESVGEDATSIEHDATPRP